MEVERIDHIQFKTNDMERTTRLFEALLGNKFLFEADFSDLYGVRLAFNPFPLGVQVKEVTNKDINQGQIFADAPEGICTIALKVPDIEKAIADMESMGYKLLFRYEFGPVKEALFDAIKALTLYVHLMEYPGESTEDLLDEASEGIDLTRY